ncbi:hypothetical protein AgCh_040241 [Apium graveolens]
MPAMLKDSLTSSRLADFQSKVRSDLSTEYWVGMNCASSEKKKDKKKKKKEEALSDGSVLNGSDDKVSSKKMKKIKKIHEECEKIDGSVQDCDGEVRESNEGKTLAFGVPTIMHVLNKKKNQISKRVNPQCHVLSPTRELAQQVRIMPNADVTTSLTAICVNTEAVAYMFTYGLSASARLTKIPVTLKLSVILVVAVNTTEYSSSEMFIKLVILFRRIVSNSDSCPP